MSPPDQFSLSPDTIDRYIAEKGDAMGTLVAFSGAVNDAESGPEAFTERSPSLNPGLKGDIREAFKADAYQILLVANKFQTGFDQPLLCAMDVDRRLDGIQAVQTLSRLNRCHPGKDTTYVVDFINDPDDILAAFKTYYETAALAEATDPNLILDLKTKRDAQGHDDDVEIDRVVNTYREARLAYRHAEEINAADALKRSKEQLAALTLFRSDMGTYCRFYTFLSQIFDYGNTALEKRWLFYKRLLPLLEFEREISTVDLSKVVLTHHHLRQLGSNSLDLQPGKAVAIPGLAPGGGGVQDKDKVQLEEIIAKLNEIFGAGLPEEQLNDACQVIPTRIKQSQLLQRQAAANTKDQFAKSPDFDHEFVGAVMGALDSHQKMSTQLLNSSEARLSFKALLLHHTNLYDDLRMRAQQDGP